MVLPYRRFKRDGKDYIGLSDDVKSIIMTSVFTEDENELSSDVNSVCVYMMQRADASVKRNFLRSLIKDDVITFMTEDFT